MQWRNNEQSYGAVAKTLHWLMFLFIAGAIVLAMSIDTFPRGSEQQAAILRAHESFGLTVLLLVALRIAWRLANTQPTGIGAPWQQRSAHLAHGALYVLMC